MQKHAIMTRKVLKIIRIKIGLNEIHKSQIAKYALKTDLSIFRNIIASVTASWSRSAVVGTNYLSVRPSVFGPRGGQRRNSRRFQGKQLMSYTIRQYTACESDVG